MATFVDQPGVLPSRGPRRHWSFHLIMALVLAGLILGGFGVEAPDYFIHPAAHRPAIMFVTGAAFTAWVLLYVAQTALVNARHVLLHRRLGWITLALAVAMPPLGTVTEIVMQRFNAATFPATDPAKDIAFLAVAEADLLIFAACAWLGGLRRRRPDQHRRLMFLATASLADNGIGRLPIPGAGSWFYAGNCILFGVAMLHDRRTIGRIHRVLAVGVPAIAVVEGLGLYLWLAHPAWWVRLAAAIIGLPPPQ